MNIASDVFFRSAENLADALQVFEEGQLECAANCTAAVDPVWSLRPRDMFLEIVAVGLGNLYNRIPLPSPLHDKNMLDPIVEHLCVEEAGKRVEHSEDWVSSAGLVKIREGRENQYVLSGNAIAVLSQGTGHGVVGDLLDRVCVAYSSRRQTAQIRAGTRLLTTNILSQLGAGRV